MNRKWIIGSGIFVLVVIAGAVGVRMENKASVVRTTARVTAQPTAAPYSTSSTYASSSTVQAGHINPNAIPE